MILCLVFRVDGLEGVFSEDDRHGGGRDQPHFGDHHGDEGARGDVVAEVQQLQVVVGAPVLQHL